MPVLAGILDPDFIDKPIKRGRVPHWRLTHLPVLAGVLGPYFNKNQ